MYKILVIILSLLSFNIYPQMQEFSPFEDDDKIEVLNKSIEFIKMINEEKFDDIESYLTQKETNIQGDIWLQNPEFIKMFGSLVKGKSFETENMEVYNFDDIINSPLKLFVSNNLYRVFSDINVLIRGNYTDRENSTFDYSLVFGKFNSSWKITSIHLSDVNLIIKNSPNILDEFRIENITNMNISFPVPNYFSDRIIEDKMVSFILEGETPRDAIIQVVSGELKAPIEVMTYKWADYIAFSRYNTHSVRTKLHPLGTIIEYVLEDENGDVNQGITIGIENNDSLIIMQIFSFKDIYHKIWQDIDLMIRNIEINVE